jgi:hypothetical protein
MSLSAHNLLAPPCPLDKHKMKPWSRLAPMQAPPNTQTKALACVYVTQPHRAATLLILCPSPSTLPLLTPLHSTAAACPSPKSECNHQRRNNHATSQHQRQVSPELTAGPAVCTGCTALCASAHNSWRSGGNWGGGGARKGLGAVGGVHCCSMDPRAVSACPGQIPPQGLGCFGPQVARRTGEKT